MDNRILQIKDENGLRALDPDSIEPEEVTPEALDHILRLCDGLWSHSGDPKQPHAEISGGLCSDGYVNLRPVLMLPTMCALLAKCMVHAARKRHPDYPWQSIRWVIGSDHTSATLSYEVARLLKAKHDFTERGPDKTQLWRRGVIGPDEVVLQVESLIASGATAKAVRHGLRTGNKHPINFFPAVLALAHRANFWKIDHIYPIYPLRHYEIRTWDRAQCPLHQQGSISIYEPQHHWSQLTASY